MADLGFLFVASKIVELINPAISAISLSNIVGDIRTSMLDELDFRKEAQNLENFRRFLEKNEFFDATAPMPFPQASGQRVLTMEYLKGVPLVDLDGIRKFTSSPEATLISALRTWAASVATNDIFHADVHAGNLLVLEDGRIGFIDFGIVGKISDSFRAAIYALFGGLMADDYKAVAAALVKMGATKEDVNIDRFASELSQVIKKINDIQPELLVEMDSTSSPYSSSASSTIAASLVVDERETTELVLEIVNVATRNGLRLPREFGLVLKQALYFDRYQKLLAPQMDPLRDARLRGKFGDEVLNLNGKGEMREQGRRGPVVIDVEAVDVK
jgi:aarF domain-containing kinase